MSENLLSPRYSILRWALLIGVIALGAGIWLWHDYQHTLETVGTQQANVAKLLETHTTHVIANTNLAIERVMDEVRDHDIMGAGADRRWPVFVDMARMLPVSGRLWLYAADGSAVMASHLRHSSNNASDRKYFTVHRQPGEGLFIGETVIGKTTGRKVFNISRRLEGPDGLFAGVVMAAIDIDVFIQVVSDLSLGESAAYTLIRNDGAVIMRHPDAGAAGKRYQLNVLSRMAEHPTGLFTTVSVIDGIARQVAYRKHADLPLTMVVSVSRDEILAPWRQRALAVGGGLLMLIIIAGWLTILARKAAYREQRAITRMQTVLDAVAEGICGIDAAGWITFINPAGARLLGYEPAELLGKNLHDTCHYALPDGTPHNAENCPIFVLQKNGGERLGSDLFWKKDGRSFAVEYAAVKVNVGECDEQTSAVIAFRDISGRVAAESELRATLDALREAANFNQTVIDSIGAHVAIIDGEGVIVAVNQAWTRFARSKGIQPSQVGVGVNYLHVIASMHADDDDSRQAHAGIRAVLAGESREFSMSYPCHSPDAQRWFFMRALRAEGAEPIKVVITHENISDIMVAQSQLEALNTALEKRTAEAEAANIAKSRFLATMSHEIRTPMNGILGMAQLLLIADVSEAERQDYARIIYNSGQSLLTLLNDILDLSKIEAGKVELESLVFEPGQLIDEITTLFSERASAKGLRIEAVWHETQGQRYRSDPVRLRQMLSNLVSNAIKFTSQGDVRIEGRELEGTADGEVLLEFCVSDSGIGIPAEKQALLFKPFSQADVSTTRQFGGTGLGLSIVRNLARLMGGDVTMESEVGKGSRIGFRIRVSQIRGHDESRRITRTEEVTEPNPLPQASTQLILIVEDNATNRFVIEAMLKRQGLRFESVENGSEAVDRIMAGALPDLVLMDCQMPVMDGFEATSCIRQWEQEGGRPRLPVIALTAGAFAEDHDRCIAAGMDDFLTKPLDIEDLKVTLQRWLGA